MDERHTDIVELPNGGTCHGNAKRISREERADSGNAVITWS